MSDSANKLKLGALIALVVGIGIGYWLDRWLGTWPWLFLVFFVMGSVAGVLNVYRLFNPHPRSRS